MAQRPVYLEQTYNGTRLHSALDYVTPDEYERAVHPSPMEVK